MASGIVVLLAIAYFEQVIRETGIADITRNPLTWISLGAFVFHAANLPYMISLSYLVKEDISLAISVFYVYMALNCIMFIFYTIAFLCPPPPPR
jgi:hypothetical protein